MPDVTPSPVDYAQLLAEVKERIRSAQYAALKAVNTELVGLYWLDRVPQAGFEPLQKTPGKTACFGFCPLTRPLVAAAVPPGCGRVAQAWQH